MRVGATLNDRRDEILGLVARSSDAVFANGPDGPDEVFETDHVGYFVTSTYSRSRRLLRAVLVLLKKRLPDEALILARSLFSDSLRVMLLAQSTEDKRRRLVLRWFEDSANRDEAILADAEARGYDPDRLARDKLKARQAGIATLKAKYDIKKGLKFPSEKDAAQKVDRMDDYWLYEFAHLMVHGSDAAFSLQKKLLPGGGVGFFSQTDNSSVTGAIGFWAASSAIHAAVAANEMMGWEGNAELPKLLQELEDFDY